jgi:hypothetical protein
MVGDGYSILFWKDLWLDRRAIQDFALDLVTVVAKRSRRQRMVASALHANEWFKDIAGPLRS